ncbi:MAG: RNA methyltransferase [candidate division Zixibacteria bacterium]|nr:RNA methyltransferase [candidate division Zixibacteria bacterium]MCI0596094.1 RNA methyltransferase [candidate division Zixibacteria bacterium]
MPTRKEEKALRQSLLKKTRKKRDFFVVEGERALAELLKSGWEILKIYALPQKARKIRSLIPFERTLEVEELPARKLSELTQTETSPGVLALVEKRAFSLEAVAAEKRVLILDNVRDPGNVGTLLRTARSLGWSGVAMLKGTVELYSPKVVRATAGALFHLKIAEGILAEEALDVFKGQSFAIWVADSHSGVSPEEYRGLPARPGINQTPSRVALVIGSEAAGVSREMAAKADQFVKIPLSKEAESLNAAVSGGILMYLLRN